MSLRVISASRRLDMVGTAPGKLVEILTSRFPPSEVHTLVIWTKNPTILLTRKDLRETVSGYTQLFVHCTVTGMGATRLEPSSPPVEKTLSSLGELVGLVGSPERVRVRFDPIVHLVFPGGREYSNMHHFGEVASAASSLGIPAVTVSWMECYPKVGRRLAGEGIGVKLSSAELIRKETQHMQQQCAELGLTLLGCCAPHLESSRCIDGRLFNRLHPLGLTCSEAKAVGQRVLCGCTKSLDIGWYTPCAHGCLYCYANPGTAVRTKHKPWPD